MDKLQKRGYADSDEEGEREPPAIKFQGYVYSWGKNKDGELSVGNNKNCPFPTPVRGVKDRQIQALASGGQHSACLTEDGLMMIVGSSLHSKNVLSFAYYLDKLGIEDLNLTYINTFQMVTLLKTHIVKQISCGEFHTLALLGNFHHLNMIDIVRKWSSLYLGRNIA